MALNEQEEFELLSLEREKAGAGTRNLPPPTPTFTPGPAGFRKSLQEAIAADVSPTGAAVVGGLGTALDQSALRLKQLISGLTPQEQQQVQVNRELSSTPLGFTGAAAGNLLALGGPIAGITRAAAPQLSRFLPGVAAPIGASGVTNAGVTTATNPVLPGESEAANTALGFAGGVGGDLVARGLGRMVHPIRQSAPVRALLGEGIVPTPGQAAGATSLLGRVEQRLQSIPIIGDIITHGRTRAVNELNEAAINRAVPAGQPRIQGIGRGAIEQADQVIADGYNDVLGRIGTVRVDPNILGRMGTVIADPDLALPPAVQQRLHEIVQTQITGRAGVGGQMQAQIAKRADANLGQLARTYASSTDADQRMMARGLREIQTAWRDNIRQHAAPELQAELDGLNRAFANFVRVERAAGASGAREGVFSPAQLQSAVRATDTSARKGQFAQGRALMQNLSDPAMATLPQTVPNSGTIDRGLLAMLAGGGLAGANEHYGVLPGYVSAALAAPLLYSRLGSRYAVGNLPGQGILSQYIRDTAPYTAQVGRVLAQ